MKRSLLKSISLIVVLVFISTLFAGCGTAGTKTEETAAAGVETTQAVTETAAAKEPDNLRILVRDNYAGVPFNDTAIAYIEEKTNTKLDLVRVLPDQLDEKVNLMLAGNENLDIIQFDKVPTLKTLIESDLLQPLNDLIDQKAPNLKKNWPEEAWKASTNADGNIYHVPYLANPSVHFSMIYRKDWLDKLGMQLPTTIDEYFNVAVAMAKNDPDGNNKADTFAFGAIKGFDDARYFHHIFGAYGTVLDQWIELDGKIVNGTVAPAAKEALKMVKKLFDAGAIDPEFITDDGQRADLKYQKGIYGASNTYTSALEPMWGYYKTMKENYPNGEYIQGPNLTSTYTTKPLGQSMLPMAGWLKTSIVKASKNQDAAIRLFDWYATDEGAYYYNYGMPDADYTVDSTGRVKKADLSQEEQQKRGISQIWLICRDLLAANDPSYLKAVDASMVGAVPRADDGLLLPEMEEYDNILKIFYKEQYAKMVVGEIPIDGGFEDFVKEWNARGGKQLTDAINAALGK